MRVLVTGASGFVGRALVTQLVRDGVWVVRAAYRHPPEGDGLAQAERVHAPSLGAHADWAPALAGCDAVVHSAARVHVMHDRSDDPLAAFRAVNVDGTRRLAEQAASAGVRRFVFVSSIKVNGEETTSGAPFSAETSPAPQDPYGVSKWEAECALHDVGRRTGMAIAIVRPVLVYGPGVGANFGRLLHAVHRGLPLPLRSIDNRRSLVALDNLTSLIATMLTHPDACGGTFLVSDDDDLSTPELLRRLARALGTTARLLPLAPAALRAVGTVTGQREAVQRLLGSLQVDIRATTRRLDWRPPVTVDEALAATALAFRGTIR